MPKIFLIKKRLHEQQLGLQEGHEFLANKSGLCAESPLGDGPIALLSKKDKECVGKSTRHNETIHRTRQLYIYILHCHSVNLNL